MTIIITRLGLVVIQDTHSSCVFCILLLSKFFFFFFWLALSKGNGLHIGVRFGG